MFCGYSFLLLSVQRVYKNPSRDEISEREPFYDDIAHVLQNTKKENLLRSTNYCVLSLEFMNLLHNFHPAVTEYLYLVGLQ